MSDCHRMCTRFLLLRRCFACTKRESKINRVNLFLLYSALSWDLDSHTIAQHSQYTEPYTLSAYHHHRPFTTQVPIKFPLHFVFLEFFPFFSSILQRSLTRWEYIRFIGVFSEFRFARVLVIIIIFHRAHTEHTEKLYILKSNKKNNNPYAHTTTMRRRRWRLRDSLYVIFFYILYSLAVSAVVCVCVPLPLPQPKTQIHSTQFQIRMQPHTLTHKHTHNRSLARIRHRKATKSTIMKIYIHTNRWLLFIWLSIGYPCVQATPSHQVPVVAAAAAAAVCFLFLHFSPPLLPLLFSTSLVVSRLWRCYVERRRLWFLFAGWRVDVLVWNCAKERQMCVLWPDYVRWCECALSDFYSIIHVVRSHSHNSLWDSMGKCAFTAWVRARARLCVWAMMWWCESRLVLFVCLNDCFARHCCLLRAAWPMCVCARPRVCSKHHSVKVKLHLPTRFNSCCVVTFMKHEWSCHEWSVVNMDGGCWTSFCHIDTGEWGEWLTMPRVRASIHS